MITIANNILSALVQFAPKNSKESSDRPMLEGIYFEISNGYARAVACDGSSIAVADLGVVNAEDFKCLVPYAVAAKVGKKGNSLITIDSITTGLGSTKLDTFTSYPDYKRVLPKIDEPDEICIFNLKFASRISKAADLLSVDYPYIKQAKDRIYCSITHEFFCLVMGIIIHSDKIKYEAMTTIPDWIKS